jgi:hypothetical protein
VGEFSDIAPVCEREATSDNLDVAQKVATDRPGVHRGETGMPLPPCGWLMPENQHGPTGTRLLARQELNKTTPLGENAIARSRRGDIE